MRTPLPLLLLLAACEPAEVIPDFTDSGTGPIECDDPIEDISLTFVGTVTLAAGGPAVGAEVKLVNRADSRTKALGTATTDSSGRYTLSTSQITWWPGCSGYFTDYWIQASLDGMSGAKEVDFSIFSALEDETQTVDLTTSTPIEVE